MIQHAQIRSWVKQIPGIHLQFMQRSLTGSAISKELGREADFEDRAEVFIGSS